MKKENNSEDYHKRYKTTIRDCRALLCNNVVSIDPDSAFKLVRHDFELLEYDEEEEGKGEPMQYFLIDNKNDAESFTYLTDGQFIYSKILELYICAVYSLGTSWSYVYSNKNV